MPCQRTHLIAHNNTTNGFRRVRNDCLPSHLFLPVFLLTCLFAKDRKTGHSANSIGRHFLSLSKKGHDCEKKRNCMKNKQHTETSQPAPSRRAHSKPSFHMKNSSISSFFFGHGDTRSKRKSAQYGTVRREKKCKILKTVHQGWRKILNLTTSEPCES